MGKIWVRFLFLATLLLALAGCGSSSSSSDRSSDGSGDNDPDTGNAPITGSQGPGGIWLGEMMTEAGGFYDAAGLITEDGELHIVTADAEQTVGTIRVSGSNFTATLTAYAADGEVFEQNGKNIIQGSAKGTFVARKTFAGSASLGGVPASQFLFLYDDLYERATSLASLSGTYSKSDSTGYTQTYTITSDGSVTGSDTDGCALNGKLSILNSNYNLFRIRVTVSNCDDLNGEYSGLAALTDWNGLVDTLIVSATGPTFAISGFIPRS